ncbi:uncharacterized protein LOC126840899 isoform X2 [Adelges cooleyi]|uniref:uncharacterized protein LOC126840899 isoform X2 n=1 Tax=Adelges cooleyi TaxID=133065 RepID=UPI00217FC2BC|nr:uncharacterized protein LOC126840899 isoform X2 [Adelges cooleyi]
MHNKYSVEHKPIHKSREGNLVSKADQVGYCLRNSIRSTILIKMKFFCFLISFVFVIVSAFDEADYKKEVYITNVAIGSAWNYGLEHVIETMVNDNDSYKCFAKINFMIALPDHPEIVNEIPEDLDLDELRKSMHYQFMMRLEIKHTLRNEYPEVDKDKEERRRRVVPSLKNIFRRVFDGSLDHVRGDVSLMRMCRLIGLYISTTIPTNYIKRLNIEPFTSTCILWDGIMFKRYRKINDVWWQIDLVNTNGRVQLLEEQLR